MFAHMPIIRDIIYGAAARGASIKELCSKASIDSIDLNDSEKKLDFVIAFQVWELAVKLTNDKLLGLHLGESANPTILGLVGHLMQSSPTLKNAFENVSTFGQIATDMFTYSIRKEEDEYILSYNPAVLWVKQSPDSARQATEQAMAGTLHVFYLLSGEKIVPKRTAFQHRKPVITSEYERVFNSLLKFNWPSNELVFAAAQLEKRVLSHDQSLFKIFNAILQNKKTDQTRRLTLKDQLQRVILSHFAGQPPPIEVLASHLNLGVRSLQRKLRFEKVSYRQLSSHLKMELARQLLNNADLKVGYISTILGYSEPSAFRRAYKSWTNASPRKARKS
ncbi:AraC family transcriptional regulator [soil metagenome]